MKPGEEITVHIEEGKTLFIKLIHIGEPDAEGHCNIVFELNGVSRHVSITDNKVQPTKISRAKADESDPGQVPAPMPGMVASIAASVGHKVSEGDNLMTLEAMKMFTTVTAPQDGTIKSIHAELGDQIESGDLLVTIT